MILNFTAKTQRAQRVLFFSFAFERQANEKLPAYGRRYSVYLIRLTADINFTLLPNHAIRRSDL